MKTNKKGNRKNKKKGKLTYKRRRIHKGGNKHLTTYPPESIKNYISNIIYVNLDSRTDRKEQIENELKIFNPEQIHRVPGIVPEILDLKHRNIALAKAHLNAIKLAIDNNWSNVLILEDDSVWANIERAYPVFEKLINQQYNVIMLNAHHTQYNKETYQIHSGTSGAAYLLHHSYYNIYYDRLKEMIDNFDPNKEHQTVEVDKAVFGPLQKEHKWLVVVPSLMIQLPGFSDRGDGYTNFTKVDTHI